MTIGQITNFALERKGQWSDGERFEFHRDQTKEEEMAEALLVVNVFNVDWFQAIAVKLMVFYHE